MKKMIMALAALCMLASCAPKEGFTYSWEYHEMDARFDRGSNSAVEEAISKYDSLMAPLQEVICYSKEVYAKNKPESALSDFLADALREQAEKITGETIEVGLTNFGGIRTDMPQGAVRVYDIYSIAPFENYVTVLDVKGSTLRKLFERFASGKYEALSGVRMKADNGKMTECLVAGKPLDDKRTYKLATIDFLVTGGDGIDFGDGILARNDTGVLLRDAYISYLKDMMAAGKTLDLKEDGRMIVTNPIRRK